jgi:hypothetical protein
LGAGPNLTQGQAPRAANIIGWSKKDASESRDGVA